MTITKIQNAPNVILQCDVNINNLPDHALSHSQENQLVAAVNVEYNAGASTVKAVDQNNVQIGIDPRPRP